MYRIFQAFVDRLTESADADALRQGMAETVNSLDLCCFAYLSVSPDPKIVPQLISTYPSNWTAHYVQHHYERFDPVIIRALEQPLPFEWGLGVGPPVRSESERELFEEAARFGIRYGFTIPIHDKSGVVAAVTFAADERHSRFERSIRKHAEVLQLMAMYFHAHARRKLVADDVINGVVLSPREIECLKWAAQGKSAWETGRILGISRHTVAFHLDNAKTKLGVRSTIQAVVRLTAARPNI
ncbi:LuxR family transcriptional activator of conjugal transfer of Ti plasmids [Bradyrhizobium sp. LM6.10]|uniref:LuxR family transcriptional regulator n=1 Tax=unclassified Bradyrhizobium TaxID=2631580 RepID=UPI001FF8765D|nr:MULTISPECIES: LuxR family transcriptional regulator [unclassified Bradyrhizobium]MCK1572800.1 LuxR family transcriptional regulator [Bradyrhizobium sp. 174]MCK1695310.1 LuxR family transcriptional regulator [Bradyrhizobium sp. 144]